MCRYSPISEKSNAHIIYLFKTAKKYLVEKESSSDENIYVRDIIIFPVVSFVNFFSDFFLLNKYFSLSRM